MSVKILRESIQNDMTLPISVWWQSVDKTGKEVFWRSKISRVEPRKTHNTVNEVPWHGKYIHQVCISLQLEKGSKVKKCLEEVVRRGEEQTVDTSRVSEIIADGDEPGEQSEPLHQPDMSLDSIANERLPSLSAATDIMVKRKMIDGHLLPNPTREIAPDEMTHPTMLDFFKDPGNLRKIPKAELTKLPDLSMDDLRADGPDFQLSSRSPCKYCIPNVFSLASFFFGIIGLKAFLHFQKLAHGLQEPLIAI